MTGVLQGFAERNDTVRSPDDRINSVAVDRFTLVHLTVGALMRVFGIPLAVAVLLSAWFEVTENVYQGSFPSIFPNTAPNDSLANSVCDTAALVAGWTVAEIVA